MMGGRKTNRMHATPPTSPAPVRGRVPRGPLLVTGLVLVLTLPSAALRAQEMIGSGHALDSNLRIGSGGYNGGVGGGGRAYRFGPRPGFGVDEGATGESGFGAYGSSGFRRGVYRPHGGGLDTYNAFVSESGGYTPLRGAGSDMQHRRVQGTGGQPVRPRAAAAAPPRQVSGRRVAAGFDEAYDSGYQASLADATYDSEAAQKQANALAYGIGFALGEEVANALALDKVEADPASVITGFREALNGDPAQMSGAEIEELLHALFERVLSQQLDANPERKSEFEKNIEIGNMLRARFAREPGVVSLDNGLQYMVLTPGTGDSAGPNDTVTVEYRQLTPEGAYLTELTRRPVDLRTAVEGVRQTLTTMKVGGVWRVVIPYHLAHGEAGRPPQYGPGETLFFEVELLAIE